MVFQFILWFLPWRVRRCLLQWKYGWRLDPTSYIGKSIILARMVVMGSYSRIHSGVFCKRIDLIDMGEDSGIATFTYITGFSTVGNRYFKHVIDRRCELVLGKSAGITSRHYIDCNGGCYIGDFSTVAGIRSQILTHSIDIYHNRQDAKPVKIGQYCFVGTGCILLPGSVLPDYSVLGAGSVLTKSYDVEGVVYAGSPAKPMKSIDVSTTKYFHRKKHVVN